MFPTTRRSVLEDLLSTDATRRARSLDVIARAYWKPVYRYIRLRWNTSAEATEDLAQSFFETALDRDQLGSFRPGRARFRTFLRVSVDRHVIDQHRSSVAARRGGGRPHVDFGNAEAELVDTTQDPEALFDAEWLRNLLQLALDRLDATLIAAKKPIHAAIFRDFHVGDSPPTYSEAAARHGVSVTDITNWLHVARREFRRVALDMLREVTLDDDDFAAEARAVFGIDVGADP